MTIQKIARELNFFSIVINRYNFKSTEAKWQKVLGKKQSFFN